MCFACLRQLHHKFKGQNMQAHTPIRHGERKLKISYSQCQRCAVRGW